MRFRTPHRNVSVPVFFYGHDHSGKPFKQITRTLMVSADGGCIELDAPVAQEQPALLINMETGRSISCHVTSIHMAADGKAYVGIHFALPSPRFWGLELPREELHPATRKRPQREVA